MSNYIEDILLGMCDKLQLTPTLYSQAEERYFKIADIIQKDSAFKDIKITIYPHGSFRLKTTVKPLSGDDYDLDFVAELPAETAMTPQALYDHIFRILKSDGIHDHMIEAKKRCIRVNYANDFHMDIMPGKLINAQTHEIIVPDRALKGWSHHSNPIGFAEWFENQAKTHILLEMSARQGISHNIEKISDQEVARQLEPLRRAVQLVKRYRDIYCEKNKTEPVRSIIICTLMGQISNYSGDTLQIMDCFCQYVNSLIRASRGVPFTVKNPVVDEILSEKWAEGDNYKDFVTMMNALTTDIKELKKKTINKEINTLIKKMFGETITNIVLTEYTQKYDAARSSGQLSVDEQGTLRTGHNGIPIKKNTFYGVESKDL